MELMSTVAEQLRPAREAQKLTVQQVADTTKIRTDHITALEEGNYSVFSAPDLHPRLREKLRPAAQAGRAADHGRAGRGTEPHGKIQRTAALHRETNRPLDRIMFLLAKLNMKVAIIAGVILGIILMVLLINAVLRHNKNKDPLSGLPTAGLPVDEHRRYAAAAQAVIEITAGQPATPSGTGPLTRLPDTTGGCARDK